MVVIWRFHMITVTSRSPRWCVQVMFTAKWAPPCMKMESVWFRVASELNPVLDTVPPHFCHATGEFALCGTFLSVDVDENEVR